MPIEVLGRHPNPADMEYLGEELLTVHRRLQADPRVYTPDWVQSEVSGVTRGVRLYVAPMQGIRILDELNAFAKGHAVGLEVDEGEITPGGSVHFPLLKGSDFKVMFLPRRDIVEDVDRCLRSSILDRDQLSLYYYERYRSLVENGCAFGAFEANDYGLAIPILYSQEGLS